MGHESEREQDEHLSFEEASPGETPGERSYGMTGEAGGESIQEVRDEELSRQGPNEGGGAWTTNAQVQHDAAQNEPANDWSAQTVNRGSASGAQSNTAGGAEGTMATPGVGGGPGARQSEVHAGRTYTVEEGDTLQTIAARFYGSAVEYERIYRANQDRLGNSQQLSPGQELIIPSPR